VTYSSKGTLVTTRNRKRGGGGEAEETKQGGVRSNRPKRARGEYSGEEVLEKKKQKEKFRETGSVGYY